MKFLVSKFSEKILEIDIYLPHDYTVYPCVTVNHIMPIIKLNAVLLLRVQQ